MPGLRIATASGNWSNSAIWDGGLFPVAEDIVCANGFTINIDQDINVGTLTTTAQSNTGNTATMTSNITPSGYVVAASSDSGVGFEGYRAFAKDGNTFAWRSSAVNAAWISYQFPSSIIINRYSILASSTAARCPNTWTFEAWNGSSWVQLHSVTNSSIAVNTQYNSPLLGNTTAYSLYRINITAVATVGNPPEIAEIYLYESNYTTLNSGVAGGGFLVTGSRNITCTNSSGVLAGSTTAVNFSGSADSIIILNGNIVGSSTTNGTAVTKTGTGVLNVNGNLTAVSANRHVMDISATGSVNIVGNIQGSFQCRGLRMLAGSVGSTLNITGIINPSKLIGSSDIQVEILSVCNINITGIVYGAGTSGAGLSVGSAATINITGTVTGGAGGTGYGINSTVNHYLNIVGPLIAYHTLPNEVPAVISTGTGAINIFSGPFISAPYGTSPFTVFRMHYRPTSGSYYEFRDNSTNGALSPGAIASASYLYAPSTVISAPNQNDVRFGTVYASGSQTGQMRVPLPSQVSIGIPVDNTVGTAVLSTNDVVNAIWNSSITELTASNSIGNRLKNVSTPDITANQIIGLI